MGVYIPNMEKPKDCYLCEFTNGYECWSNGEPWFDVKEAYAKRTLSPNCPLIEIDLVRCGECKHSKEWYRDRLMCHLWAEFGVSVFEDGFCNYGERRKED